MNPTAQLADAALRIAARGAREYMHQRNLDADAGTLFECVKAHIRTALPEALEDARQAIECNMGQVAEQLFATSMLQAGIEAAKECAMPVKSLAPA